MVVFVYKTKATGVWLDAYCVLVKINPLKQSYKGRSPHMPIAEGRAEVIERIGNKTKVIQRTSWVGAGMRPGGQARHLLMSLEIC